MEADLEWDVLVESGTSSENNEGPELLSKGRQRKVQRIPRLSKRTFWYHLNRFEARKDLWGHLVYFTNGKRGGLERDSHMASLQWQGKGKVVSSITYHLPYKCVRTELQTNQRLQQLSLSQPPLNRPSFFLAKVEHMITVLRPCL